jgi:hypothetical protein
MNHDSIFEQIINGILIVTPFAIIVFGLVYGTKEKKHKHE